VPAPAGPQDADQSPCGQIAAACQSVGYAPASLTNCIDPIMQGTALRLRARQPFPKVSPQLVADCKASDPNFGHAPPESTAQTLPVDAPPAAAANGGTRTPTPNPTAKPGNGPNLEE
jgi:hypothetical protein